MRARELSGGGVDVVVDPVGDRFADPALRASGWMGRYLVIGFAGGEIPRLPVNQVLLNNRTLVGVDWGAWTMRDPAGNQALLAELMELAGSGALHPSSPTSTRSTTSSAPSPTSRTARWPARSSSSLTRPGHEHHRCRCSSSVTKANRSCS